MKINDNVEVVRDAFSWELRIKKPTVGINPKTKERVKSFKIYKTWYSNLEQVFCAIFNNKMGDVKELKDLAKLIKSSKDELIHAIRNNVAKTK